ncbi:MULTISPECIES: DUF547 domain-containing protein [Aliivibrio]|uniref:DUF547 domain-containing protein n=1 Tax=Aliivibrio fischeri (strain MJ11) TaxID=388396 RepID=B5FGH0_ALIFM|nr:MULTISPECIES: DUF547 domain-containing protein [Aliivibrio]ACH64848.1 conserved hypothetical protein [Aliivibrio fischeri MJ11]MBD1570752.1 DUF547 domain-containing protein [Aliivibrio sp. S10_S31]MCE4937037.1 DUF547 domain-containing protein [Aliivibrio fischeri]MUH96783.1 DUF547 domain-containing protein [Aliivibrio fischeri]MUI64802.1 DUF547 domain-containing protein [Aliivibrio fischeri]
MKTFISSLLLLFSFNTFAAPKSELWSYWNVSNEKNATTISHQYWQQTLDKYLITKGEFTLFDYAHVTDADERTLNSYLRQMSRIDPREYKKSEQYAYWVNLYNALTVKLILMDYPIESITKLGGLFSFGPWDEEIITVAGKALTLNDIEHRILRPIWNDPRTHYAVNCASLGCPNLQPKAFTARNSDKLLDKAASEFINSDKGVLIKEENVQLSSIYDWFVVDFGNQQQLFEHLKKYRPELKPFKGDIRYDYNWKLNQQ